jgi:hypothetical protein
MLNSTFMGTFGKLQQQRTMSLNVEKNNKKMRAPDQVESMI